MTKIEVMLPLGAVHKVCHAPGRDGSEKV